MRWKRYFTFNSLIWSLVVVFALHATCWPLVQNAWAIYHWETVPCKLHDRGSYAYLYRGKGYVALRVDFWDRRNTHGYESAAIATSFDRTCHVAPGDPVNVVLNLDAHRHLERGLPGLAPVGLAACVATIITVATRRKSRFPPAKPTAPSEAENS